jgi:hypothetical protein
MSQLIGSPFQQQPPPHGSRSFFHHSPEQPVELRPALVCLARQVFGPGLGVQGVRHDSREAICRVLVIPFTHASGSSSVTIIDKYESVRLILRTNFFFYLKKTGMKKKESLNRDL